MKDGLGRYGTALFLGGGSDIGLATARALVARGTQKVVLAARSPDELALQVEELRARGAAEVEVVPFDALATASHEAFVDEMFERFGDVDLVVLAFGVLGDQHAMEKDTAAALEVARTNYVGAVSVLLPVARKLREQGHGAIAVLSSVAGERGRRSNFVYGSSKAGLDVFCQGLGDLLAGEGVQLLVVRPGFVRSKMTAHLDPVPFSTTPGAVARAILVGLERKADVVWVPSKLRWVMSGLRHLPRTVFRRLEI
ncbi:MAG: decaprenylphospho-beta-D-erythro-pentofuranosid-2-ulose 2-reductase [Actinobacteria bacterium]|nr:decaprenylphospho-beta-D-erythro-pentofuranosid-2-ulose 2-reductase [Actinomycetota bacterium]